MTDQLTTPLVERGDYVRLKDPYRPLADGFSSGLKLSITAIAEQMYRRDPDDFPEHVQHRFEQGDGPPPINTLRKVDALDALFEFTHGTVAEIVSRFPASRIEFENSSVIQYDAERDADPVRNVSLHLFNPSTGLLYMGPHPEEMGKPEFVDEHVANLVIVQKHSKSWGAWDALDVAAVYRQLGIGGGEMTLFDPEVDDE